MLSLFKKYKGWICGLFLQIQYVAYWIWYFKGPTPMCYNINQFIICCNGEKCGYLQRKVIDTSYTIKVINLIWHPKHAYIYKKTMLTWSQSSKSFLWVKSASEPLSYSSVSKKKTAILKPIKTINSYCIKIILQNEMQLTK